MKKWIEIGKAERTQSRNDISYSACVTVGETKNVMYGHGKYRRGAMLHPRWTAYDDANFWQNVAPRQDNWIKTVHCCTCCTGHRIKLDYQSLIVYEEVEGNKPTSTSNSMAFRKE